MRERVGGREGERGERGEREKKVSTNRMLFSALTGTVCRCIHRCQCYWYVHSIVFPCTVQNSTTHWITCAIRTLNGPRLTQTASASITLRIGQVGQTPSVHTHLQEHTQ